MTLDEFVTLHNGQSELFNTKDTSLRGQCVQLACFYVSEVWHTPVIWADAVKWYGDPRYEFTPYVGTNRPQRGDLVVWSGDLPNSGGAGHIGIVLGVNASGFISFDSNWNGRYAHQVQHNFGYVKGWIRPKPGKGGSQQVIAKVNEDMITPNDKYLLRIGHSEIGGWDYQKTHSGQYDAQFVSNWNGKTWQELISNQWGRGEAYRNARLALAAQNEALKAQAEKLDATIRELQTLKDALQSDDERDKQLITSQVNKIEALTKDLQAGQAKVKTVQAPGVPLWLRPFVALAVATSKRKP